MQSLCNKGDSNRDAKHLDDFVYEVGKRELTKSFPLSAVIDKSVASVSTKSNTGLSAVRVGQKHRQTCGLDK